MKNDIIRKLTSLTLMSIMVAGGLTFAIPGALPQAAAESGTSGSLTVSSTEFGGQQIIEIKVNDSDFRSVSDDHGALDVTIDGNAVHMVQASTGIWYAYVADDSANAVAPNGNPVISTTEVTGAEVRESDSTTIYFAGGDDGLNGPNPGGASNPGALGETNWPFVQLYDFTSEETFDVTYLSESVAVTYDDDLTGSSSVTLDRTDVPQGAMVHVTISDTRLNLDPTNADTWTITVNTEAFENGTTTMRDNTAPVYLGGTHGVLNIPEELLDVDAAAVTEITFTETDSNSGEFASDDDKVSNVYLDEDAPLNKDLEITYADGDDNNSVTLFVTDTDPTISIAGDGSWSPGEVATVTLTAPNLDFNTKDTDNIEIDAESVPTITTGDPITIADFEPYEYPRDATISSNETVTQGLTHLTYNFSDTDQTLVEADSPIRTIGEDTNGDRYLIDEAIAATALEADTILFNATGMSVSAPFYHVHVSTSAEGVKLTLVNATDGAAVTINEAVDANANPLPADLQIRVADAGEGFKDGDVIVVDILSFGNDNNNAIYRHMLEETDNGVFTGTVAYDLLNQISVAQAGTYGDIETEDSALDIIIADEDDVEIDYAGKTDSVDTVTSGGTVSFDAERYSTNGAVVVTLVDPDLAGERFTLDEDGSVRFAGHEAKLMEFMIEDTPWIDCSTTEDGERLGLGLDDAFTLVETPGSPGTFTGGFDIPNEYCINVDYTDPIGDVATVTGKSIQVTYHDYIDETGIGRTVSDSATVQAVTGSVTLDRNVYPVPSIAEDGAGNTIIHIEINDPDHNTDSDELNNIPTTQVDIYIRPVNDPNQEEISTELNDVTNLRYSVNGEGNLADSFGETSEDSGIFAETIEITYDVLGSDDNNPTDQIAQSYIISVTYNDDSDVTGETSSTTDSAVFNLGNAVLSADAQEYTINQKAFITLVDQDRNYDSDERERIALDEIVWEGSADTDLSESRSTFDPSPSYLRETESNSGIFLVEITIPEEVTERGDREPLQRGERVTLSYEDYSPAGSKIPSETSSTTVEANFAISRTGASLSLDKDVYSWRDRVTVTVVAPDANLDDLAVNEVHINGNSQIGTLSDYRLSETGPDTGIFQGTVDLGGFEYAGIACDDDDFGVICVGSEDGFSITYQYDEDESDLVESALVRWSVAEVTWLADSYREETAGTLRVVDPDRNYHPDTPDSVSVAVFSDTYRGGIKIALTETESDSGVFEGDILFDTLHSQGNRLQVSEGDIVTAAYDDDTLPPPDDGDDLRITGTTSIGSIVPPLERVEVSNLGVVDALGNAVDSVSVGQQVNIAADLTSAQSRSQDYAYLLQIQNMEGVTVHLSWAASSLADFGAANVSQSWTPDEAGSYTATVFVWESLKNPTALSPQNSIDITVV